MTVIKSLWASVQGNPVFMRRVNGWLTMFWLVMIPVSVKAGLLSSVSYVSALSLWALVSGHWSAWQAARVEVTQMAEEKKLEADPIEQRVVAEIVHQTDVQAANPDGESPPPTSLPAGAPPSQNIHERLALITRQLAELQRELSVADGASATS